MKPHPFLLAIPLLLTTLSRAADPTLPDLNASTMNSFITQSQYPDPTTYDEPFGSITATYHIKGTRTSHDISEDFEMTFSRVARRTKDKTTSTVTLRATVTATRNERDKDGKPCKHTTITNYSQTKTDSDTSLTTGLVGSKKLALCRFMVPPLTIAECGALDWTTKGSGCNALGPGKGSLQVAAGDSPAPPGATGAEAEPPDMPFEVYGTFLRIPDHSSGNTPFAQLVKTAEAAGKDSMGTLSAPSSGLIEAPWNGSVSNGSFTANLLGGDTPAVRKARQDAGESVPPDNATDNNVDPNSQAFPGTLQVSWNLSNAPAEDLELVLEPQAYNLWIPEAGKDEKSPGNNIQIKATLQTKSGKPPTFTSARQYTFELTDVSHEPGICINYPKSASTDPDLQFDPAENPDFDIPDKQQQKAVRKTDSPVAAASLSAYDFGAYGTLKVTCDTTDGQTLIGHLKGENTEELLLPKRKTNDSHIAAHWFDQFKNLSSTDDAADDDKQPNNKHDGDGFTLYEEYRGLYAKSEHRRLDPTKKDLLVENNMGADGTAGINLFQSASSINVIQLEPGELPDSRIVNQFHTNPSLHKGDQHALRLFNKALPKDDKNSGDTAGTVIPADFKGNMKPKDCIEVDIGADATMAIATQPAAAKLDPNQVQKGLHDAINVTIAHELAHACGLIHHGKGEFDPLVREITPDTKGWEAYDEHGKQLIPTAATPIKIDGDVGAPGGMASGDVHCIMCYNNAYLWVLHPAAASAPNRFYQIPALPNHLNTGFCTSPTGTGYNAPDKSPPLFGNAATIPPEGCQSLFNLRDW